MELTCGVPDFGALLATSQQQYWLNDCLITRSSLWISFLQEVIFKNWSIQLLLALCDEYKEIDSTPISTPKYRILEFY
jgi:hypothetical protein